MSYILTQDYLCIS